MSDVLVDQGNEEPAAGPKPEQVAAEPHLGWALAGMSAGAGVIHIAMTPIHAASAWQESLGFAAAGWFQLVTAGIVLANRGSKRFYQVVALANLAFIGVWLYSRTVGLPFGETPNVAEQVGAIDAACVALQVGVIIIAARLILAPEKRSVGRLAPALCAVAALGLATTVITSPNAANHSHGNQPTGIDALAIQVDGPKAWDLDLAIRWDLPDRGASYRTTLHNGVMTYVKDSDKPVGLTLTVPAAALFALAGGNIDAARSNGLTTRGDESQLASLFSVLRPGNPGFNIVEP